MRAIECLREALDALDRRTKRRTAAAVEGTHQVDAHAEGRN